MVRITAFLLGVIILIAGTYPVASQTEGCQLGQVVYITLSKACSCTLERCQAGDIIIANLFGGERKELLKRIDYSTDKEAAKIYMKQYAVTQAPALLFLDTEGKLLWLGMGELSEKEIQGKLQAWSN